jgi:hypothetical protein
MRYLAAAGLFLLAIVLGFGIGSYRAAALDEFMARSVACEITRIAKEKGYVAETDGFAEAVAGAADADPRLKGLMRQLKGAKKC